MATVKTTFPLYKLYKVQIPDYECKNFLAMQAFQTDFCNGIPINPAFLLTISRFTVMNGIPWEILTQSTDASGINSDFSLRYR